MLSPTTTQRLRTLDQRIIDIASWVRPANLLNPTRASRQHALRAVLHAAHNNRTIPNPTFSYLPIPHERITHMRHALDALTFQETPVDLLLQEQAQSLHQSLDALIARGTPQYTTICTDIYGLPSPKLLQDAHDILNERNIPPHIPHNPNLPSYPLDSTSMAGHMTQALRRMDILDWSVVVLDEMSARMSVSASHREVRIKTDSLFSLDDLQRLTVHELGVHVRRACNGFATGLKSIGLGLHGYLATEEGLASHMEELYGLLHLDHLKMYAWRVIGVQLAHHLDFSSTVQNLLDLGASPHLAWDITLRVKRGLTHTNISGCFPKDYVYLQGRHIVQDYLQTHNDNLRDLFLGKIAVHHIPRVRQILEIWPDPIQEPKTFIPVQLPNQHTRPNHTTQPL